MVEDDIFFNLIENITKRINGISFNTRLFL